MNKLMLILSAVTFTLIGMLIHAWLQKPEKSKRLLETCPPCPCSDQTNFVSDILSDISIFLGKTAENIENNDVAEIIKGISPEILKMASDERNGVLTCLDKNLDFQQKLQVIKLWRKIDLKNISIIDNEDSVIDFIEENIKNPLVDPSIKNMLELCQFNRLMYILAFVVFLRRVLIIRIGSIADFWNCITQSRSDQIFDIILRQKRDPSMVSETLNCLGIYMA